MLLQPYMHRAAPLRMLGGVSLRPVSQNGKIYCLIRYGGAPASCAVKLLWSIGSGAAVEGPTTISARLRNSQ